MKHKIIVFFVTFIAMTGILSGCDKKEVDYKIENETSNERSESELIQFKTDEHWTDEWTVTDVSETEYTLNVNAEVVVPELEHMSVVEVEDAENDKTFRKQFLDSFFEGNDIYYYDEAHQTKDELEIDIANMEQNLDNPDLDDSMIESIEETLTKLQERRQNAPENYVVAEEFESCDTFAGYKDDVFIEVYFGDRYGYDVYAAPIQRAYYGPKSLRGYESVRKNEDSGKSLTDTLSNECKYSMKEAKELAELFMNGIGRNSQICIKEEEQIWVGQNYDSMGHYSVTEESYAIYGYSFTYSTELNGISLSQFPDFSNFDVYYKDKGLYSEDFYNRDEITITITDVGVSDIYMNGPIVIRNVISDSVKLLPLDNIKDIMKNELLKHGEKYDFTYSQTFNSLELIYYKLKDEANEGVFCYVPVWCLSDKIEDDWHYHPVFVNAVDGTVLYMTNIKAE